MDPAVTGGPVRRIRFRDGREYRVFRHRFPPHDLFIDMTGESQFGGCFQQGLQFQGPEPAEHDPIQSLVELMSKPVGYRLVAGFNLMRGRRP